MTRSTAISEVFFSRTTANVAIRHWAISVLLRSSSALPVTKSLSAKSGSVHFPADLDYFTYEAHFGLIAMRERVKQMEGRLTIVSRTGTGTIIQAVLPLNVIDQPTDDLRDPVCGAVIHLHRAYSIRFMREKVIIFAVPSVKGHFSSVPKPA